MKKIIILLIVFQSFSLFAQKSIEKLLKQYNDNSIPYITVQELAMLKTDVVILDSRELKEYQTSHIKDAIYVGYDSFKIDSVKKQVKNKDSKIAVYCSLGIRSENIGKKLKKAGYKNVLNLYGGIFEFKNKNLPIYNPKGEETDSIHGYSKEWGKWLTKGIKVYD
ncbi:MAG: rhodanese-like domain-containing protein [Flaviramulus sp.]|nr:rhodanese-like domain-containing protein [Flaviramulus sp.]